MTKITLGSLFAGIGGIDLGRNTMTVSVIEQIAGQFVKTVIGKESIYDHR